jgi:hypothetical protein
MTAFKYQPFARRSFGVMGVVFGVAAGEVQAQSPQRPDSQATTGWLGLALSCNGCDGATAGGPRAAGPLVVRSIWPGGPAERVLRVGDTIVTVNRVITDARLMREALLKTPTDSMLAFEIRGPRGHYTVHLRKQPDRLRRVGSDSLPLKYETSLAGVGVEVLTPGAPVVSRDSSGALIIRLGEHAVRLRPPPNATAPGAPR